MLVHRSFAVALLATAALVCPFPSGSSPASAADDAPAKAKEAAADSAKTAPKAVAEKTAAAKATAEATGKDAKKRVLRRVKAPKSLKEAVARLKNIRVNVSFTEAPFADVVKFVHEMSTMNVIVGPALSAEGLEALPPITIELRNVTLYQFAELVGKLSGTKLRLTRGRVLEFTTPKAARGKPILRIYATGDITTPLTNFPGPDINLYPSGAEFEREEQSTTESPFGDEESIAGMIQEMVDPETWEDDDVSIRAMNGKLIVKTYAAQQRKVARLLALLRAAR